MQSTHTLISIAGTIRKAVLFGSPRDAFQSMHADFLFTDVRAFPALLQERQVEFVVVGGIAMRQFVESRNTEDLDLIMAMAEVRRLPERVAQSEDKYFLRCTFGQLQVDVHLTRNRLFDTVRQQHATLRPFLEQDVNCATVEGLLLLKMYALPSLYRQADFAHVSLYESDIALLLHTYRPDVGGLLRELSEPMSESDAAAVREVMQDIEQRIARFDDRVNDE